ncbi:hypothetical protein SG34_017610 [Thalassomonas viridans]|uniref:Uncharacterized protein n=1 Tax=Thalassomonas viridans TaxID=137584 RepID=A0AAE9YYD9_9GAMM|nr:hypothetical protein [Thalassomonas viridans]WDE03213.1 hypothetical protein SG34_017610 [Thalassomonas viridans]
MKLKLNKKKLKNLSRDNKALPAAMTPQVGGAGPVPVPTIVGCGANTDAFNGCPTGKGCYSTPWEACINPEL